MTGHAMLNIWQCPTTARFNNIEKKLWQTPKGKEVLSLFAPIVSLRSVLWIRKVTAQLLNDGEYFPETYKSTIYLSRQCRVTLMKEIRYNKMQHEHQIMNALYFYISVTKNVNSRYAFQINM